MHYIFYFAALLFLEISGVYKLNFEVTTQSKKYSTFVQYYVYGSHTYTTIMFLRFERVSKVFKNKKGRGCYHPIG
jgi:hypothetical protein